MNNKNIKDISILQLFRMAYYDLKSNLPQWLYLIGIQTFLMVSFLVMSFATISFISAKLDFIDTLNTASSSIISYSTVFTPFVLFVLTLIGIFICGLLAFILSYHIILIQNCLDLAFDSQMRGLVFKGRFLSYYGIQAIIYLGGYIMYRTQIVVLLYSMFFLFFGAFPYSSISIVFGILLFSMIMLYNYFLWQRIRFAGLHMLEYNTSIVDSFKASWKMTHKKIIFLIGYHALQMLVVIVPVGLLLLILNFFGSSLETFDVQTIQNIDTITLYAIITIFLIGFILVNCIMHVLYIYVQLTEAHLYRQLIDPASDNASCDSCDSCQDEEVA